MNSSIILEQNEISIIVVDADLGNK